MKKQLSFLALAVSTFAFSNTFTYKISNTPYKTIETCSQAAKIIAKRLTEQSSLPTSNARCDWEQYSEATSILVDYTAIEPLHFISTTPSGYKHIYAGFYKTLEDCKKDLLRQENIFQKETQLSILTSFCYAANTHLKNPYSIRIDAIGEAKRTPFYASLFSDANVVFPSTKQLMENAAAYLKEKNATLVNISFRTAIPENKITLFYYGEKELEFDHKTLFAFPNFRTCEGEMEFLVAKLANSGIKLPIAYCGAPFLPGREGDMVVYSEEGLLEIKESLEKFKDYKTCFAERDLLVSKYQAHSSAYIITGICQRSLSAKEYRVSLFIKK